MASPTNCMDLKAQIPTLLNVQLYCMLIAVSQMKKFIQGLPATVPAVQVFRRLSLKTFLQSLTGQTNLSFCGYTNDQTANHSKYSIAYPDRNSSTAFTDCHCKNYSLLLQSLSLSIHLKQDPDEKNYSRFRYCLLHFAN